MKRKKLPIINSFDLSHEGLRLDKEIYSRWQPNIKSANDDENTIAIYEQIGTDWFGEGFTAKKMADALRAADGKDVTVSINSPGGDFFEGAAIYNLLREYSGKVTVKIPGLAASAASIIAMAGDVIQISEIGFLMIHDCWAIVIGNSAEMMKTAETFNKFDSAMADVYVSRTGLDKEEISDMMDKDTWLNGTEAIEKGFSDELLPAKSVDGKGNEGKKSKALARRSMEVALAKQGFSRKDREEIFKQALGERDAAEVSARDAGYKEIDLRGLLETIKS